DVDWFGAYAESNATGAGYNFALDIFVMGEIMPIVATPTFSIPAGNYSSTQNVEITCETPEATIRYTLDGSEPTEESDIYTAAIEVSEPTTIKAKAFKENCIASAVAEAFYNVILTPAIIVDAETLSFAFSNETQTVNVSSLNLTQDITVSVSENFTADVETIAMNTEATITVTFTGETPINGTLTLTSGETTATVELVATPMVASEGCYFPISEDQQDWTGDYLITYTDLAGETIMALNGIVETNYYGSATQVYEYYENGVIASNLTTEACKVTVAQTENGYSLHLNTVGFLGLNAGGNKLYANEEFAAERDEWTFSVNGNGIVTITNVIYPSRQIQWNITSPRFACYTGTQSAITLYQLRPLPNVATPSFSPVAGYYETAQDITISCATEGASIYYTTDGSDPTNESTLYTQAFEVSENTTIKAIAYMNEEASFVATARYTFPTLLNNIAEMYEVENPDGVYRLSGDVTFVYRHDRYMFVKDETAGLLIYDSNNRITTEYTEGDVITGGIAGNISFYNNLLEFVPIANTEVATVNTGEITPLSITVEELLTNNYVSQLVMVENVNVANGTTYTEGETGSNLEFTQANNTAVLRNNFKTLNLTIADNANLNIVGFASINGTTIQIYPRDNEDIIVVTSIENNASQISIYPNPTSSLLNVNAENSDISKVELVNANGQIVASENANNSNVAISVENLPTGTYFVKIYTGSEVVVSKIVKF
ncbi:MAG: chitobiase/beta-hexosaminidase C-terminal domain-containing protein, partial [Bacteroidales bacterium]|nr:chitobiase/beta-hexosaminidase C-terminal domain-containing protein [Bacteroidales bacterium]